VSGSERPLLEAVGLSKRYTVPGSLFGGSARALPALRGISFRIPAGATLGLVGESGSGKTTAGRIVARLVEPDEGSLWLDGDDWLALEGAALRRRRRDVQIVFQDPQASLNPRLRVGEQIAEPLRVQGLATGRSVGDRVRELLAAVGLSGDFADRFPSEMSGGQRQRIAIARALATEPRLVVCDEPVSALDVSVAAQVLNLLLDLRERSRLSYLFISHDLAVVERVADTVAVMYLGAIVEEGPAADVASHPLHPYTAALVAAVADPDPAAPARGEALRGEPASPLEPPSGCAFHPRCPIARPRCSSELPPLAEVAPGRRAACFYPGEMG
jgi:oligopeptide/dipeptide ABC transporter ATP-binding protein